MKDLKKQSEKSRESSVKATITATNAQLMEIGCIRNLTGIELDVSDIDRWTGMYAPCSTVYVDYFIGEVLVGTEEYIIPTRWLKFT